MNPASQRILRGMSSLLLFPLDLIRLTIRFLSLAVWRFLDFLLTLLFSLPHERRISYRCGAVLPTATGDGVTCFVAKRVWTSSLLRMYCGCGRFRMELVRARAKRTYWFKITPQRFARIAVALGITWAVVVGGGVGFWKMRGHSSRCLVWATEYRIAADSLCAQGEFARARIQYLNAAQQNPGDPHAQWGIAQCALKLENLEEARTALRQVLSLNPEHREARTALVELLLQQGNPHQAHDHAVLAVEQSPQDVDALARLGECQRLLGHKRLARVTAEAALKLAPDHARALLLAATVATDEHDWQTASNRVDQIINRVPEEQMDRLAVARILVKCQRRADAQVQLMKILEQDRESVTAARELAELKFQEGDLAGAIRIYMQVGPDAAADLSIRVRMAELLLMAGRLDEAHEMGKAIDQQMPSSSAGPLVLASVYYMRELWKASAEQCRIGLQRDPSSIAGRTLLARVLIRQEKYKEAIPWLSSLLGENWKHPDIMLMLAECHLSLGHDEVAAAQMEKAMALHPGSEAPHLLLARLYLKNGAYGKAMACYENALELNPRHPVALNNLASLLTSREAGLSPDLAKALELATLAWSISPDHPQIAETLGWIYVLRREYAAAFSLLSYSARQQPTNSTVRFHLAYALSGLGRSEEALQQLDYAMELTPGLANRRDYQLLRMTIRTHSDRVMSGS